MVSLSNFLGLYTLFKRDNLNDKMDFQEEIMCDLKFIGKIQENEKINVKHKYVQQNGIATKISRSFINVDTRSNMVHFVVNTIKKSIDIINFLAESKNPLDKLKCLNVMEDLKLSLSGINNLRKTYADDMMVCCQLETLSQGVSASLLDFQSKYGCLGPKEDEVKIEK